MMPKIPAYSEHSYDGQHAAEPLRQWTLLGEKLMKTS